jgi:membrane-associated HD superfamily phosphohydrolase
VTELLRRRNVMSEPDYLNLVEQIERARKDYEIAIAAVAEGPKLYQDHLLDLRDSDWTSDKQAALQALDDLLAGAIIPGLPPELRKYRIVSQPNLPIAEHRRQIIIDLLDTVLIPNLEPDYVATEQLATKAAEAVEARVITLQAGEVIVRAGQQITEKEFAFLDNLGLAQRRPNFWGIAMISSSVAVAMFIFAMINWRLEHHLMAVRLKLMDLAAIGIVCVGVSVAGILLSPAAITFIPLASVGLMLGSFYGSRLATLTTLLLAVPLALGISTTAIAYSPILVGAILAALLTNRPHTRSHLATAGIIVAIVQAAAYIAIACCWRICPWSRWRPWHCNMLLVGWFARSWHWEQSLTWSKFPMRSRRSGWQSWQISIALCCVVWSPKRPVHFNILCLWQTWLKREPERSVLILP